MVQSDISRSPRDPIKVPTIYNTYLYCNHTILLGMRKAESVVVWAVGNKLRAETVVTDLSIVYANDGIDLVLRYERG